MLRLSFEENRTNFRANCHSEALIENWSQNQKILERLQRTKQRLMEDREDIHLDEISELYNEILTRAKLESNGRKKFPFCKFSLKTVLD